VEAFMSVGVLDHYNLRTRKFKETVGFYEGVLGFENGARPNFTFPGAWLYSEGRAVVHLVDISGSDEPQKPDSGVVHHIAFVSKGFRAMKDRLAGKGVPFRTQEVPGGALWQIFVEDPNGVVIELNYETQREAT
jgi:catechol 2,3-dioxygenase-like lactoylglutathione lyase family enzyme